MIIISTLAEYQTYFWLAVAKILRSNGYEIAFLSFDDRSTEILRKNSFYVNSFSEFSMPTCDTNEAISLLRKENIKDVDKWIKHELNFFNIKDVGSIILKLYKCVLMSKDICNRFKPKNPIMIQELGGFVSVTGSFLGANSSNVDCYFLEPSFFKGRFFITKNSFEAPKIASNFRHGDLKEVNEYLDKALDSKTVVIPEKDKDHYLLPIFKILNIHNFRRFFQKTFDKWFLGKYQDFGHITFHVKSHFMMFINQLRLNSYYTKLEDLDDFIYFPLHVPGDAALTLRSPEYLDQLNTILEIHKIFNSKIVIAIKEHPACIGKTNFISLKKLLENSNTRLLSPKNNNFDVLDKASMVLTINSKAGAEAILKNKLIAVLGSAFYSDSMFVNKIEKLSEIEPLFLNKKDLDLDFNRDDVLRYFSNVWDMSYLGDLYTVSESKIEEFSSSIKEFLEKNDC